MLFLTAIVLLPLTLAAVGKPEKRAGASCDDVHLFLARGAGEEYPGRVGGLADSVCAGQSSCSYENILYTSTASSLYCNSAAEGAANGVAQITAYHSLCPNSKLVIGGYSLGAQVVGDLLGGGGGGFYNCIEATSGPLDPSSGPGRNIAAVVLFGDTRHVAYQTYNVGTGSGLNGQYPRSGAQLAGLNGFSSKIQSYCVSTDPICALGNDGLTHTTYIEVFGATAGAWVVSMLSQTGAESTSSSVPVIVSSSSSTAAAVPSTSSVVPVPTPSSSLTPFVFSTSSSVTSVSVSTTSSVIPVSVSTSSSSIAVSTTTSSPTIVPTPFVFSSTSIAPVTASSIAALSTAPSSLYTGVTTFPVSTQPTSSVPPPPAATSPTPTNSGVKATGYPLSFIGLTFIGALIF